MTKLQELKARHAELRKQITDESKAWMTEQTKALFEKYPKMKEFSWTQYTPYWNDRDVCTFSVNSDPMINGSYSYEKEAPVELATAYEEVERLISSLGDDTLKEMFGDHQKVTVTRKGVKASEYSHD